MRMSSPRLRPMFSAAILFLLVTGVIVLGPSHASAQVRRERPASQTGSVTDNRTQDAQVFGRAIEEPNNAKTYDSLKQAITRTLAPEAGDEGNGNLFNGGQYEEVTVTANDGASYNGIGYSVAISGNTAVVGTGFLGKTAANNLGGGYFTESVYVFVRSGNTWTQQAKLVSPDADTSSYSGFGQAVAISGDTIAVGAPFADSGASSNEGAVYIFTRSGDTWTVQTKLSASDGMPYDEMGHSVSLDGDTVAVGAPYADASIGCSAWEDNTCVSGGSGYEVGAVYVFVRSGTVWSQQQKLTTTDSVDFDLFGFDVAVSGDTLATGCQYCAVGANDEQGSGYIFKRTGTVWNQEARLVASDGAQFDYFGFSVDVDGDTAIFGAPCKNVDAVACTGAAYRFTRSGATWTQASKYVPTNYQVNGYYGYSVALSGNSMTIAYPGDALSSGYARGSVDLFKRSGSTWARQQRLAAYDGQGYDIFGLSTDISGDTVIVGVPLDDIATPPMVGSASGIPENIDQGSARIFQTKIDITKESAIDGASSDWFGRSVAISGDTAVVGAPLDDVGSNVNQGSAYVYIRTGSIWIPQAKLSAADGAAGDNFGWSVSIDGDTIVVGSPLDDNGASTDEGSAYVFTRSIGVWTQQQKLSPDVTGITTGGKFGWSVAVNGTRALAGEPYFSYSGSSVDTGRVTQFRYSAGSWNMEAWVYGGPANMLTGWSVSLTSTTGFVGAPGYGGTGRAYSWDLNAPSSFPVMSPSDVAAGDDFGWSMSASGDTVVVGSPRHDLAPAAGLSSPFAPDAIPVNQGAAYVYTVSGFAGTLQQKVTASDNANNDQFGYTVSVSGDNLLIGAYGDDIFGNADQGSAYMFTRSGSNWAEQRRITDSDGAAGDGFGWAVGVSTNTAVIGAWADDVTPTPGLNPNQGSANYYYWGQAVPTAAGSRLSGQVVAPDGRALAGATVVVTDASGNTLTAQTGTFGNFSFEAVPTGQVVIVNVRARGYQFSPQVLEMLADQDGLKITASVGSRR